MSALQTFAVSVWGVLLELAPWLLLGAVVSGALHVLLPPGWVRRELSGPWGVVKAVMVGVPMPLCSCGVIPTGLGLKQDGASNGAAIGFITATPQTGVDSVLVSAGFLGWPFALAKVLAALVTGIVGGLLADVVADAPSEGTAAPAEASACGLPSRGLRAAVDHALELVQMIWGWLTFGILLSAALSTFLPPDAFARVAAAGPWASFGVVLLASIPMYVCATASVPVAAALVGAGLPTGAAMVFLMAGPATNVATLGAVWRSFGSRVLAVYLGTLVVGSVAFGMMYEAMFGALSTQTVHAHVHDAPWWATLSAVLLVCLLIWFAVQDGRQWWSRRSAEVVMSSQNSPAPIIVGVGGMTCGGCSSRLERLLSKEDGVLNASVSLDRKEASVVGTISTERIREIVENAGFEVLEGA